MTASACGLLLAKTLDFIAVPTQIHRAPTPRFSASRIQKYPTAISKNARSYLRVLNSENSSGTMK
jgi:hypothetical protein